MRNLIYVPIEHIGMRYTTHLDIDIEAYLKQYKYNYIKITPPYKSTPPPKGQFFNSANTIKNKMQQLDQIAGMYESGMVTNDTIFFFSDLWFPGIESIAYMNYFYGVKPKITGIIHAGSFTDTDFVRDMERWAKNFEDIIFDICDEIYCASHFIKDDIIKKRIVDPKKLIVTGLPLDSDLSFIKWPHKDPIVIFNGRLCDEKQPHLFDSLKERVLDILPDVSFIKTHELNLDKRDYYALLAKSRAVVSYALQENFGFGVAEAVMLGCIPIVPNRLVYKEMYESKYRYNTFEESVTMTFNAIHENIAIPSIKLTNPFKTWFKNEDIDCWF